MLSLIPEFVRWTPEATLQPLTVEMEVSGEIGWIMGGVDAQAKCNRTAYGFADEMDRQQQETEEYVAKRSLSSSR